MGFTLYFDKNLIAMIKPYFIFREALCLFLLSLVCSLLHAKEDACTLYPFPYQAKKNLNAHQSSSLPSFKGLILISDEKNLNPTGYQNIHGILIYHLNVPGPISSLIKKILPLVGTPLNQKTITKIKQDVVLFYAQYNHPLVIVSIPEQNISAGIVQLIITESKLGAVKMQPTKWFNAQKIQQQIRLQPGEVITSNHLDQDLDWLNRNPFLEVNALYTPGELPNTTDIELLTKERFPLRVYTGIDNTGNDITGNNRLFLGVDWGNVFWTHQRLSYQFATSSDFKRFQSHLLFYTIPLPWRHILNMYGGYSHAHADFSAPNLGQFQFTTKGFTMQASLRYDILLNPYHPLLHQMTLGFDFKRTDNNISLGGERPVISKQLANLTQLMIGYQLGYEIDSIALSFEVEGFYSPGKWIADQSNSNFNGLRPFAKNKYVYTRGALTLDWAFFKQWSYYTGLRWQLASDNLLPSEEYGVGGYNTVRGYKERFVNGDDVFIVNLEVRTPPFSLLNPLAGWKKFHDICKLLLFLDYGFEKVKKPADTQSKTHTLVSIGPGIRYTITPYLIFRADWGFQLVNINNDPSLRQGAHQKLHFALIAGY